MILFKYLHDRKILHGRKAFAFPTIVISKDNEPHSLIEDDSNIENEQIENNSNYRSN